MDEQITKQSTSFLHWLRDGGFFAVNQFPAGTPCEHIADWRRKVAANGGATTEVHELNPMTLQTLEKHKAAFRQRMKDARAAKELNTPQGAAKYTIPAPSDGSAPPTESAKEIPHDLQND
ncbi:hypothetical protein [Streptomyces olivoreticuli]|uniref:hypothetical protein n=1 Tax=Streptomyces olivoreticuli TaxID=68246 RepID=UPI0013C2DF73|nr:hypothetical protein [Streptomyces olivoreticuli]